MSRERKKTLHEILAAIISKSESSKRTKADESVFSILEIGRDEGDNNPGRERTCEANEKRYVLSADPTRNRFHGDFFGGGVVVGGVHTTERSSDRVYPGM